MSQDREARKAQLEAELKEIHEQEAQERDKAAFERIVQILDNADVLLSLMQHSRSSCSDEHPDNGYTTEGRGGHFRCDKCGFMEAAQSWKARRERLIKTESGKEIEEDLNCHFGDIHVEVRTTEGRAKI